MTRAPTKPVDPQVGRGAVLRRWRRWFPRAATIGVAFTALCCLGVSAALSLASSVGAGFFLRDETLRPLLITALALTILASWLTFRRHHNPIPLMVTVAASAAVYGFIFVGAGPSSGGNGHGDHSIDAAADESSAVADPSGARGALAWSALAVLLGAQAFDIVAVRRCRVS